MSPRVLISESQRGALSLSGEMELVYVEGRELSHRDRLLKTAQRVDAAGVYLSKEELEGLLRSPSAQGEASLMGEPRGLTTERAPSLEHGQPKADEPLLWLIDDEASVRVTVRRWLTRLGYRVELFERGDQLLAELTSRLTSGGALPSLLICDADMPEMSGISLLNQLRVEAPELKRLLYTGREPSKSVIEAFNQGVIHRFIDKQDGPQALQACLSELLADELAQTESFTALAELLQDELIELYVQPIFNAQTRALEACEALMRSKHPAFKGPLEILDATSRAGRELDLQRLLSKQSLALREALPPEVTLFLNIDPVVFSQPEALDELFSPLYLHASGVVLELTERGQLCGEVWVESVRHLRSKGFQIALDDLGAGYNSLGAVAAVSPEIIKLDISLVSGIHQTPPKREMVQLLSDYARKYGIKTVAEGIEHSEEAEVCSGLDLTWLQGYFLSRPMPFERFQTTYL